MAAATRNFTIEKGATNTIQMTWLDSDGVTPVNLTGFTGDMQVRRTVNDTTALLTMTTENGGITLGGVAGTVTLTFDADGTRALVVNTGVYDVFLTSPGGVITKFIKGTITFDAAVTRDGL
jgi:hypothetical protein